jgi:hypothetical protein
MEECKRMATPMITNVKKVKTSDSKLVDPTLYMHLIGSLMYLVNSRPNICFAVNTLSVHGGAKAGASGSCKTCA